MYDSQKSVTPSILLLVDRRDVAHQGLNKAMLLARHLPAPLELFLCETTRDVAARGSAEPERQVSQRGRAQEYLQALRQSIVSTDVPIRCETAVAASLAEGLKARLQGAGVLLVVSPMRAQEHDPSVTHFDRSLLRACSVPLLLTRQRAWRPVPRFGAALDLSEAGDEALCRKIVQLAEKLAERCGALLEYLFVGIGQAAQSQIGRMRERLDGLATHKVSGWLHYRSGEPRETLGGVVAERGHDLLLLGLSSPTPRSAAAGRPWIPLRLLQAGAGDVLLVPSAAIAGQAAL